MLLACAIYQAFNMTRWLNPGQLAHQIRVTEQKLTDASEILPEVLLARSRFERLLAGAAMPFRGEWPEHLI